MRLVMNRDLCIGAGQCVLTDPDLFDQDEEDGRVMFVSEPGEPEITRAVRRAVQLCPSGALTLASD